MQKMQPDYNEEELEFATRLHGHATQCPPLEVLNALGLEVLPEPVERAAAAHLDICPTCQMLLRDLQETTAAPLSSQEQQRIAARLPAHKKQGTRTWAIAAAVAFFVFGIALWKNSTHKDQVTVASHAEVAPVFTAKADLPPIPFTHLAPPNDTGFATRGSSGAEPATEILLPAFRAYNAGDYRKAETAFRSLQQQFPKSTLVPLYLGVSQLYLDENDEARKTLATVTTGKRADAARWYEAVAASRLHSPAAQILLRGLCDKKDSAYSEASCKLLP